MNYSYILKAVLLTAVILTIGGASSASAQRRDFMTDEEIELVRDAQDIDLRIDVLTKMIDRRFAVLGIEAGGWKQPQKESETWGDAPKGSRIELLLDIKKLLQKAIDDIDNLSEHPNSAPIRDKSEQNEKQAKKDARRFPDAVRNLAAASKRYQTALKTAFDKTTEEKEKGPILASIEFCDQIIEAATKLPAETEKK